MRLRLGGVRNDARVHQQQFRRHWPIRCVRLLEIQAPGEIAGQVVAIEPLASREVEGHGDPAVDIAEAAGDAVGAEGRIERQRFAQLGDRHQRVRPLEGPFPAQQVHEGVAERIVPVADPLWPAAAGLGQAADEGREGFLDPAERGGGQLRQVFEHRQGEHARSTGAHRVPVAVLLAEPPGASIRPGMPDERREGALAGLCDEEGAFIGSEAGVQPRIGDRQAGRVLAVAQIEDGIGGVIALAHRDP